MGEWSHVSEKGLSNHFGTGQSFPDGIAS